MSVLTTAGIGFTSLILDDFLRWQEQRRRAADYVPGEDEKAGYIAYIQSDTVAKIEQEVAAEAGAESYEAGRRPPKPEPQEPPQPDPS